MNDHENTPQIAALLWLVRFVVRLEEKTGEMDASTFARCLEQAEVKARAQLGIE